MRPHRRRQPIDHVLIAGDLADVAEIAHLLARLPETAYGQVLLEVGTDDLEVPLVAPPRVTVNLLRSARTTQIAGVESLEGADRIDRADGTVLSARGASLAEAVSAWIGEWVPEEPDDDRALSVWIGSGVGDAVAALWPGLPASAQRL